MTPTFQCASCGNLRQRNGSGVRLVLGMRRQVCLGCRTAIDKAKRVEPMKTTEGQRQFSRGGRIHVSSAPGYVGRDVRVQIDPETFKGGEFTRIGIGRYIA